ncbi:MAG: SDR family oxidoreductase [Actinobacteria bacterium]|nr:SDR family oxidoreductase [Actinomycetota bacterium]
MDLGLAEARVMVTGGASHIGRAIVLGFAGEGARITIVDRDQSRASETAAEALAAGAPEAGVVAADLGEHEEAVAACAEAESRMGGVDVLAANVGWNQPGFFLDYEPEIWPKIIDVNLSSCMSCVRALLPGMMERRRGAIVATTSMAAFGEARQSVYAAAKAGLVGFARSVAKEYGRYGVRANLVAPGLVIPGDDSGLGSDSMWQHQKDLMNDEQVDYVRKLTPVRRLSEPRDIADAVLFLASDRARQVTGQTVSVAGGFGGG